MWDLLFEMIREGWQLFRASREETFRKAGLYSGGDICYYGSTYELGQDHPYKAAGFAGYCGVRPGYAAAYADYNILPVENRYTAHGEEIASSLDAVLSGEAEAVVPIVSWEQKAEIAAILREEIAAFAQLYEALYSHALSIMQAHAPESVGQLIGPVIAKVLLFETVALIGGLAVKSGGLKVPRDSRPLGGFLYRVP